MYLLIPPDIRPRGLRLCRITYNVQTNEDDWGMKDHGSFWWIYPLGSSVSHYLCTVLLAGTDLYHTMHDSPSLLEGSCRHGDDRSSAAMLRMSRRMGAVSYSLWPSPRDGATSSQ